MTEPNENSLGTVLAHPSVAGHVTPEAEGRIREYLAQKSAKAREHVIVKVIAGVGAWFVALFGIILLALMGLHEASPAAVIGAILLGAGIMISRAKGGVFVEQLALALAMCGNGLILMAIMMGQRLGPMIQTSLVTQAVVATVVYLFLRNDFGRFLAAVLVPAFAVSLAFSSEQGSRWGFYAIVAVEVITFVGLFLWKARTPFFDVLAYVAAVALPGTIMLLEMRKNFLWNLEGLMDPRPMSVMVAVALAIALWKIPARKRRFLKPWLWVAWAMTAVLAAFTSTGLLVGLLMVVTGRLQDDRWVTVLGWLFLIVFMQQYYYALDVTLAAKSWIMAGSGLLLLAACAGLKFVNTEDEKEEVSP